MFQPIPGELPQRFVTVLIIEKEDEFLFPFDQRKYVDFFIHLGGSPNTLSVHPAGPIRLPGLSIGSEAIAR